MSKKEITKLRTLCHGDVRKSFKAGYGVNFSTIDGRIASAAKEQGEDELPSYKLTLCGLGYEIDFRNNLDHMMEWLSDNEYFMLIEE